MENKDLIVGNNDTITLTVNDIVEGSSTMIMQTKDFISFSTNREVLLQLNSNGDIYIKGNFTENSTEIVRGLEEFLKIFFSLKIN